MTATSSEAQAPAATNADPRLPILLAMAMFVLVVDTSIMNVSISAVVARPRHRRERHPVRDRARGAGLGRVHPHRQQDRRPVRTQARVHPGSARLRDRRPGDGPVPDRAADLHLLGGDRWPRRVAPAARHAVAHPRQLRGSRPEGDLRAGRRLGGDRGGRRAADRRVHHDVPVVSRRVPARGRRHRDRPGRQPARPRRAVYRAARDRPRRRAPVGPRDGRPGAGHPRLAGRRRGGRPAPGDRRDLARRASPGGWSAASARASRPSSIRVCSRPRCSGSGSRASCSRTSRSVAR